MLEKGYFCTFLKEFVIIDIDIKFLGLSKYTLEIHKKNFIHFKHFLYAKMTDKRNFLKSTYVAGGVNILIAANLKQKNLLRDI